MDFKAPDDGFNAVQIAQLKLAMSEVVKEEFSNVGLQVDDEDAVFEARRDFALLRWIRTTGSKAANAIGWAVILAVVGAAGTVLGAWFFHK